MKEVGHREVLLEKQGDTSKERDNVGDQVRESKDKESAACGNIVDLNDVHSACKYDMITKKE